MVQGKVIVQEKVSLREYVRVRYKRVGRPGYDAEIISSDEPSGATGRLVHKDRVIDWGNQRYREVVADRPRQAKSCTRATSRCRTIRATVMLDGPGSPPHEREAPPALAKTSRSRRP